MGRVGLIYKSTDGGNSWTQINHGAARTVFDVVMLPGGLGLAVGEEGTVLRTTDFGQQWIASQLQAAGQFSHIGDLQCIEFVDSDTIIVGGQYGRIYRSDDAGLNWTQLAELGGNAEVFDTHFIDEQEGWAFGVLNHPRGFIEHTTDGGQTWERLFDGEPFPTKGQMFDADNGRALIPSSSNLFTSDGFQSDFFLTLPGDGPWYEMEYADASIGWYAGPFGNIMKTTNGGFNFQNQSLPGFNPNGGGLADSLTDLRVLSPVEAYVTTVRPGAIDQGRIYKTINGSTWSLLDSISVATNQLAGDLLAIDVLPTGEIWTAGIGGFVFASAIPELPVTGDINGDGVLDLADHGMLYSCLDGPLWSVDVECLAADLTDDGFVDLHDVAWLTIAFGGP